MIVELRNYTLQRGRRDELVALFEREFLETQEAAGMTLIGHFTVLGDANRFVWLRGFAEVQTRAASLAAFYEGPVWTKHRNAANAMIVDSDNVLLLRPARSNSGFATVRGNRFLPGRHSRRAKSMPPSFPI
ncbi:MAG: NIPSNAP family protein [Candidatus Cybelea sp.]